MTAQAGNVPVVSVLMPVRNGHSYLPAAMASILGQTMRDFECIVVDDGSTDATPGLLAGFAAADPRVRVLTQPALGLVAALNAGLHEARACLVARMDADDIAISDRLDVQRAFLYAQPDAALVCGAFEVMDPGGRTLRTEHPPATPDAIARCLRGSNCIAHPTVMFRAAAVRDLGGYRAAFPYAEDYDLWLRLAERHRLASLDRVVLRYRQHRAQATWQALEQQILSVALARVCAEHRVAGRADPSAGVVRADRAALRDAGCGAGEIAQAIATGAVDASRHARRAGWTDAARRAAWLGLRQRQLRLRSRLRCGLEWARALVPGKI